MIFAVRSFFAGLLVLAAMGAANAAQTITWETLSPEAGAPVFISPNAERRGNVGVEMFGGSKSDFEYFLQDMELMRQLQPAGGFLNTRLDGQEVRIAGYVTPVGFDDESVDELLFVPFLGACIHVPPPEANQIIHVSNAKGVTLQNVWEPMWLSGRLRAKPVATILADVGYRMENAVAVPYDGDGTDLGGIVDAYDGDGAGWGADTQTD
jgi:hypothetical protein